jgi:hypothetical protein
MKPEKAQLLHDLALDESRRDATLLAAAGIFRRRRHWRAARQTLLLPVLTAALALVVEQKHRSVTLARVAPTAAQRAAATPIKELTDEQLLSLFPNTPVGLATLPNGKKLLLFLRPADAAKYTIRL